MSSSTVQILVIADTHLTAGTLHRMPAEVWRLAGDADLILHAGDVVEPAVLEALAEHAPVRAVLGNNDHALVDVLPTELRVTVGGLVIALLHDAGPKAGRERRLVRRFPEAGAIVYGHSHEPVVARTQHGGVLLNPGSPTHRRRQPVHTVGWLEIADGAMRQARIIEVGPLARPPVSSGLP